MTLIPAFEVGIWNAWIFMIWLLIQNFGVMIFSKELYKKAGQPSDMKISKAGKIANNISMPLWLLITLYSVFLPFQLETIWFYMGLVVFLLSLVMNIFATFSFSVTPVNKPVTKGMYRYSRHPIYVAILLTYLSVGIASASWIFLLAVVIWAVLISFSVADEENYCIEKYGDAYREYMNRTPRWIGAPRS